MSDLFGRQGRELLARLDFPEPWHGGVLAAVQMIDELDREITQIDRELKALGSGHRYVPLLQTVSGERGDRGSSTRQSAQFGSAAADRCRGLRKARAPSGSVVLEAMTT